MLFKAAKGVILASGDCSGNQEMRDYYCPDLRGFKTMSPTELVPRGTAKNGPCSMGAR